MCPGSACYSEKIIETETCENGESSADHQVQELDDTFASQPESVSSEDSSEDGESREDNNDSDEDDVPILIGDNISQLHLSNNSKLVLYI